MPLYEYQCHSCHEVTETLQKFSDAPLTVCPRCGGQLSKLMSVNSFQLKGGGWYATDYAKKPAPCAASPTGAAKPESGSTEAKGSCPGSTSTSCPSCEAKA
ncbi:MAG: zinc ribbon domain-containing protein [Deltaproteobacteria bacterium]|jgi:putative FmdB family regulatory protein|nr:zinc ribbon domain-containing protein [Deltaproteobacteria bacterium]